MLITKNGAWLNYSIETTAAGCILVGLLMGRLLNRATRGCYWQFLLITIMLVLPVSPQGPWLNYKLPIDVQKSYPIIEEALLQVDDPVLCEDASLLMRTNKIVSWEPSVFVLGGYYKTTWNQTPFVNKIENSEFNLIVLNYDVDTWWLPQNTLPYPQPCERLTEEMATAIVSNYSLVWNSSSYWMYSPKVSNEN
jgi:hypothetical protein